MCSTESFEFVVAFAVRIVDIYSTETVNETARAADYASKCLSDGTCTSKEQGFQRSKDLFIGVQ